MDRTPQHIATVAAVTDLAPRMRRVTLDAPTFTDTPKPAQDVELLLPGRARRRYTVRNYDVGRFDLDAVLHGDGPAATWFAEARVGDQLTFTGPRGRLDTGDGRHLFVGDESAQPAIAELTAIVPSALAIIETDDEIPTPGEVHWVFRDGVRPGTSDLLRAALDRLQPAADHTFLLGESLAMIALRPHVPGQVTVKGYWNAGRGRPARPLDLPA